MNADPCGNAMTRLQAWLVDHHPGVYDVSTADGVASAMIALTHEPPLHVNPFWSR